MLSLLCGICICCLLIRVESKLAEKQQWLDSEVETLLRERSAVQALQQVGKILTPFMYFVDLWFVNVGLDETRAVDSGT